MAQTMYESVFDDSVFEPMGDVGAQFETAPAEPPKNPDSDPVTHNKRTPGRGAPVPQKKDMSATKKLMWAALALAGVLLMFK